MARYLRLGLISLFAATLSLVYVGCGDDDGTTGATDAGSRDSGRADSGSAVDSGAVDSGAVDSGAVDSGAVDSGHDSGPN